MAEQCDLKGDLDYVEQVKKGDRKAFSTLVKRHQKGLLRLCLRLVRDLDAAEDIVQEAFIKAYEKLDSFESRASFKSWLYQIAVNTAKNKLRERKDNVDISLVPLAVSAKAETELMRISVAQVIQGFVEELPFRQRTALVLRIYEDLSFHEIAEIMECPYDTAKANYRHALLKLKDQVLQFRDFQSEEGGQWSWSQQINQKLAEVEP